jgi:hypothetical protein
MNRSVFLAFGLAGAVAIFASPVAAQHRRGGDGENRGGGGDASPRTEQRAERPAPQPQQQPRQQQQAQPRQQQQAQPQQQGQPQQQQPRAERGQERRGGELRSQPRVEQRAIPREQNRGGDYRAVPRTYAAPRYVGPRNGSSAARSYSGRYYGPRYDGPRFRYAPRAFYRPYYVFRPRFSIGFGIWAGYPITYYDPFYYPYDYSYSSSGPVPPQGAVGVQPYQTNMGGVSFEINPSTAEIWVDGNYYGTVDQFTPSSQPLGLPPGPHHIELREPGYQVSSFDVDVVVGQVIPFQGQLER